MARLEDQREERTPAQLRNAQVDVAGLGRQRPRPGAVALRRARVGTFVTGGADHIARLGFDQLLQHHPNRLADQIHGLTRA
jgi:hypothetical protein